MKHGSIMATAAMAAFVGTSAASADTLPTHRIPAVLAAEAASEAVAASAKQGYQETAVVLDADGTTRAIAKLLTEDQIRGIAESGSRIKAEVAAGHANIVKVRQSALGAAA
jgi:hypothetical protein